MTDDKLLTLDLFSGIGGFTLGLERAGGFKTIAFCETDPFCQAVLEHNWPGIPILGDIKNVSAEAIPGRPDVITGGFPCQPFSSAGRRRGVSDPRYLWPEFFRIIGATRPSWVIAENVPGIIGSVSDRVCLDLEGIGYSVWPIILPASALGAPHLRKRLWILAHSDGDRQHTLPVNGYSRIGLQEAPVGNWWQTSEPGMARVGDGIPSRLDRSRARAIGNSIVPQIAEALGRIILWNRPR